MSTRRTKLHREAVFADCSECLDGVFHQTICTAGKNAGEMRERVGGDRKGGGEEQKTGEIMREFAIQFALPW